MPLPNLENLLGRCTADETLELAAESVKELPTDRYLLLVEKLQEILPDEDFVELAYQFAGKLEPEE